MALRLGLTAAGCSAAFCAQVPQHLLVPPTIQPKKLLKDLQKELRNFLVFSRCSYLLFLCAFDVNDGLTSKHWLIGWLIDAKRCVNKTSELTYAHSDCCCHLFAVVYNSTRHYRLRRFALWQCLWFVCSSVSCKIGEVIHYVAGPGSEWGLIVLAPVHLLKLKTLTFVIGVKTFLLASRYNALVQTNNTPVVITKEILRNLIDL